MSPLQVPASFRSQFQTPALVPEVLLSLLTSLRPCVGSCGGIEMVIRRPVPEKVLIGAQYVGMAIVLMLMIFAFGNDIWQHILH